MPQLAPAGDNPRWSLYILRCRDGSLYTGIATDVVRRLSEHESGLKGARYLRGRGPLQLVYYSELGDRSIATRAEIRVKRLRKGAKEKLVRQHCSREDLLSSLGMLAE